jgi:NMD protein affecting ribosome stability and mRNA decay
MSKRQTNVSPGTGRHAPRQHTDSAVTKEVEARAGKFLCTACGAEYHEKHWYTTDSSLEDERKEFQETLCPGCYRIEKKIWQGEVLLEGELIGKMREELTSLIRHVESKCWQDNPASRISSTEEENGRIAIKTTTEWLATRIGKELKKAFKGKLVFHPSPEKDMVSLRWTAPPVKTTRKR